MSFLINRCRARSHLVDQLVEAWQQDYKRAMLAVDLEEVMAECMELSKLLHHAWKRSFAMLFDEKAPLDIEAEREIMLAAVERAIATHQIVLESARVIKKDYKVAGFDEFAESVPVLERLKATIEKKWPTVNNQRITESMSAYRKGEFVSPQDLLADASAKNT